MRMVNTSPGETFRPKSAEYIGSRGPVPLSKATKSSTQPNKINRDILRLRCPVQVIVRGTQGASRSRRKGLPTTSLLYIDNELVFSTFW